MRYLVEDFVYGLAAIISFAGIVLFTTFAVKEVEDTHRLNWGLNTRLQQVLNSEHSGLFCIIFRLSDYSHSECDQTRIHLQVDM
jgi:hypothetical protein